MGFATEAIEEAINRTLFNLTERAGTGKTLIYLIGYVIVVMRN